jgi:hypothetical protein
MAIGHPQSARTTTEADLTAPTRPFWDLHEAEGSIGAVDGMVRGTFQFDVERRRHFDVALGRPGQGFVGMEPAARQSSWYGMSGAALWVNNQLVGVITADDSHDGPARLIATRLDHVLGRLDGADPDRAAQMREAIGLTPGQGFEDADFDPRSVLDDREFKDLTRCLVSAAVDIPLRPLWRQVTGRRWPPPEGEDVLNYVGELREKVDAALLFKFVTAFAAAVLEPEVREDLDLWVDATAMRYGVDLNDIRALREELRPAVLLVQLEPDLLGGGWQCRAWTYTGNTSTAVAAPDEPWGRTELAEWLSKQLGELVDDFDPKRGTTQVTVEFLVDNDTLMEDLESLPVTLGGEQYQIGATCPVVMRSLERFREFAWRDNWEGKWRRLKQCGDSHDPTIIHWILQAGTLHADPTHVATALAYAWPHSDWPQILHALLESGTPVALWHRASKTSIGRRPALERILGTVGLSWIPERVLKQRIYAANDDEHIGRNLVLLWDDPDRVPPVAQWQAPRFEGV